MEIEKLNLRIAAELMGLGVDTARGSVDIPCPICGKGREKKMNLNFQKNVFRCNKCDEKGGPLHLWAIYRNLSSSNLTEVSKDYYQYMLKNSGTESVQKAEKFSASTIETTEIASMEIRNRTYSTFLSILNLNDEHRKKLLARGLDEETIRKNGYKSYPLIGRSSVATVLGEKGCTLDGVPGFYKKNGSWELLNLSGGILIPQRDGFGRIQGLQVRLDNSNAAKYITLSTGDNYDHGTKGITCPHLRIGEKGITEVILTEGPLKGDIISMFTGYTVFAMPGVNALSKAKKPLWDLKNAGMKKIYIAFDMDFKTNPHVQKALNNLKAFLAEMEILYCTVEWDDQNGKYKGFDDYLAGKK